MTPAERKSGRTPLMVGNWKMFKTSAEGRRVRARSGRALGRAVWDREVMVAPPFTGLYEAVKAAEGTCVSVAAQDVFWEWEGAYTGEVSAAMLADLGCEGGDHRPFRAAPVLRRDRRVGGQEGLGGAGPRAAAHHVRGRDRRGARGRATAETVLAQAGPRGPRVGTRRGRRERSPSPTNRCGPSAPGRPRPPEIAQEAIAFVRKQVAEALGKKAADAVRILYGGSVGPNNIDELMAQPDIDGVLVGGASLQLGSFARIVQFETP